jgi:hypothetical protein
MVRSAVRYLSIAIICAGAVHLGVALVLGRHYSVSARNVGTKPITVAVAFSDGAAQRWALEPGGKSCMAAWVDRDGALSVRVGKHKVGLYIAADMGANITAEVTESSVRILDRAGGRVSWRQCWWP